MADKRDTLKNDFEDSFEKSLKSLGYLFPSTEDEVKAFEKKNKIEEVPDNYSNASMLISKSKQTIIRKIVNIDANKSSENLARVARKGINIPEDILKKMKLDRDDAEHDKK